MSLLAFILGAGTALALSSYDKTEKSTTYAKGGKLGEKDALLKELYKLQRELNSHRLSTYIEGDNSEEEMARQKERQFKLVRFNEILKTLNYAYAKGGSIYIGSVNKLIDFVYFNPITAASMTDEQIGKKFYLPTNVAGKIRMAVKKNYTNKEIYDILRE